VKIYVVLESLCGEQSIAELCHRAEIASSMYYGGSREFLEAGKKRRAWIRRGRRPLTR
jgi:transposase